MNIALLSTIYPFRGGIAQFNGAMYQALAVHNSIEAFTFSRQYPQFLFPGESQYVLPNDNAVAIESKPVLDSVNPLSYYRTANKIKQLSPDVLLMGYWFPFLAPSLGKVASLCKKKMKVITVVHNAIPHESRPFDTQLSKYFFKQNHGFVVLSEQVKRDLQTIIPNAKCLVTPHPLYSHFGAKVNKDEAIGKLKLPTGKKLLLYFGYIRDYKGLDVLIDAMKHLSEEYHLIIAGESYSDFSKYTQQIEQSGVGSRISLFNRYIPDEEVTLLFSAADVCVLSYKSATQSGVSAIALHFETPLLVTPVGGLEEMVKHGETGMIIPKPEPSSVAQTVNAYFNDYSHIDFAANIRKMKQALSWETFAQKLTDFAKSL